MKGNYKGPLFKEIGKKKLANTKKVAATISWVLDIFGEILRKYWGIWKYYGNIKERLGKYEENI